MTKKLNWPEENKYNSLGWFWFFLIYREIVKNVGFDLGIGEFSLESGQRLRASEMIPGLVI